MNKFKKVSVIIITALVLGACCAGAVDVPAQLQRPDGKSGDTGKPVKVYILAGQSNMVGFGTLSGAKCRYTSVFLTADPDASFGPYTVWKVGNYNILPLGIYVSADSGAAKGAMVSIYKGAFNAASDYDREKPVKTATVALGVSKEALPVSGDETCVARAFIEVPETGIYTFSPGYGDSARNVMTLDGKEVYRRNAGEAAVRQEVALEKGRRYPVKITYFKGGSAALWLSRKDLKAHGDLQIATQREKEFPWLIDDDGKWTVRNDVTFAEARVAESVRWCPLSAESNGKFIGPELGFGYVVGTFHDEQVLLIKTAMGNRSLGFDFRPPSSGRNDPTNKWESLEYSLMVEGVRKTLDKIAEVVPGYKGQGYEIAGFAWWQGHKDKDSTKEDYEKNLVNLINDLRKEFKAPKMPAVVATVGFHGYGIDTGPWKGVWDAQMAVGDPKQHPDFAGTVASVDTRGYWRAIDESPSGEDYHYNKNAETYMLTGDALGRAMVGLLGGKAEPLPYGNRPKPARLEQAAEPQEKDEAGIKAAMAPILLDGIMPLYKADERTSKVLSAEAKGEKPSRPSQFLEGALDSLNLIYNAAGINDYDWRAFGPDMNNAEWEYYSFDLPDGKGKGYRAVAYPEGMENWFAPEFDAGKAGWKKGLPPFGQLGGKLEPLGGCINNLCLCGVPPRTLWEKEVLVIRGRFDIPPLKEGHRYRFVVGGSNHVMSGEGYAIYVNGKLLAESKTGVPNRAGGQPRGGHIYADLRDQFKGGEVTLAVTSFLQLSKKGAPVPPRGHLTVWMEEQKIPPAVD